MFSLFDLWPEGPLDSRRAFVIEEQLPGCYCSMDHGPWSSLMAENPYSILNLDPDAFVAARRDVDVFALR